MAELLLLAVLQARLTPKQREAFIDHHLIGRTLAEISPGMGVTRQEVGRLAERARRKLAAPGGFLDERRVA